MRIKKILSVIICFAVIASALSPLAAAAQSGNESGLSSFFTVADGIIELITRTLKSFDRRTVYGYFTGVADIPELDKGYVPQGFCYVDSLDVYAVTAYASGEPSIISLVNASNGARMKTVYLGYADGTHSKAHAGGIADIGDSLIVTIGDCIKRIKLSDIELCGDYSTVVFSGSIQTDLTACSYACSYGDNLLVGEFYTYTSDSSYTPDPEHFNFISLFERSYTYCEMFDMSDLDAAFSAEKPEVKAVFAMPNSVQGIAFDGKILATAISYGRNNDSYLKYYNVSKAQVKTTEVYGQEVDLIILSRNCVEETSVLPPMIEGIDMHNSKVAGIFESGAQKYSDSKFIISRICEF